MKILVAISKVPDTTTKISLKENKINEENIQWVINPYDEWYSLMKAIDIKEKNTNAKVTVLSVGDSSSDAVLRKALSYGADNAVRIDATPTDSFFVAAQIADFAQNEGFDLILTGKESIDYNQGVVGGIVAGLLNFPYAALATNLEIIDENKIEITHDVEGGNETENIQLPAVLSCTKGMAKQRTPNMRGIMAARTKPLNVVPKKEVESLTEIVGFELPETKGNVKLFDNVQDFVAELKANKLI